MRQEVGASGLFFSDPVGYRAPLEPKRRFPEVDLIESEREPGKFIGPCNMLRDLGINCGGMRYRQHVTGIGQMPDLRALDDRGKTPHDALGEIRRGSAR